MDWRKLKAEWDLLMDRPLTGELVLAGFGILLVLFGAMFVVGTLVLATAR